MKKVPFASDSEGEDFSIQSSRHYKNYKKYLKPEFQCVQSLPDGSYRAYFGYHNTNNNTITIPIGSKNKVLPAEPMLRWKHKKKKKFDQGQPTRFTPGGVCQYSFWYDYILPSGFKVTESTVNLQSDDFAYFYVNYFQAGFADYNTTFGINSYRTFTIPDYLFQNGTNTIALSFTAQNNINYAAIASKIRIKRCPQ